VSCWSADNAIEDQFHFEAGFNCFIYIYFSFFSSCFLFYYLPVFYLNIFNFLFFIIFLIYFVYSFPKYLFVILNFYARFLLSISWIYCQTEYKSNGEIKKKVCWNTKKLK